ncbi:MAG TPA: TetR/AcrR family transcriptional regulator [Allosphingosinicella sp.]|nr:TetR/AcrR family transcriptional regulator [Allosphingosinicella sp.]
MNEPASLEPARRYRGSSAEERRRRRREQLILAAIQVYGERGYRNSTVKAVCDAAGLTERYFYESFANSEALLVASYRGVTQRLLKALREAGEGSGRPEDRVRAVLVRYFEALRGEPRSARLFLVEIAGVSAELDRVFAASLGEFGLLLEELLDIEAGDPMLRTAVVGGVIHLALHWVARDFAEPLDAVAEAALQLCLLPAGALDKEGLRGGRSPAKLPEQLVPGGGSS